MSCMISFCGHWSVFLKQKMGENFILSMHLYHIFYIMQIWAKRSHSQIFPLADLDLAGQGARKFCVGVHGGSLGLLRWLMETEGDVTWGGGEKERQNKMKRLTYRVKRPCWQRWMVGLKAGGLREIYNLCVTSRTREIALTMEELKRYYINQKSN